MDSKLLHAELLKHAGYRQGAIRRLSASQLTPTWLKNNGTFRPVIIHAPSDEVASAAAIVKTPAGGITAETLVTSLGPAVPVQTFDSPAQEEGPLWTLHQWKLYWNKKTGRQSSSHKPQDGAALPAVATDTTAAPFKSSDLPLEGINKDYLTRLLCLPALPITGTPLEREISAPSAIQAVDLRTSLGAIEATPQAQLPIMLSMYPNKSFVNSTMAPGGASVWIYVVTGTATIAVSPPVAKNLATYAAWACGGKGSGIFLPSKCEGSSKAELTAGDTLILPPGYIHSLAVTSSAVILSGGFLRSDSLAVHLDALRIEEAAGGGLCRQYPEMRQLMWRTASKYAALLGEKVKNRMDNFEEKVASRALEMEREDRKAAEKARARAAAAAAKAASRPSSAAGAAIREGFLGRRRKRRADNFIQSDSDFSGGFKNGNDGDEDDEGEWIPGARQHRGTAESEENSGEERDDDDVLDSDAEQMDLEYGDYNDDDVDGHYGTRRRKVKKRGIVRGGVTGERQSKRQRARRGEGVEEVASGVASIRPVALNLAGVPSSSLKLKLKMPSTTATKAGDEQQLKSSPIKLTIKRPAAPPSSPPPPPAASATIPQVDGPGDDNIEQIELSEGEEQGLPALYLTLRRWLRHSAAAAVTASIALHNNHQNPWIVLARFELALKKMNLLDASNDEDHPPPVCVNLFAVSRDTLEPTGAPFQEKLSIHDRGGNYGGDSYQEYDGDSMSDQSGDNAAMIDEIDKEREVYYQKKGSEGSGGISSFRGNRPGSGGNGASNGGGLGAGGGVDTAARKVPHSPATARGTPGGTGSSKAPLNKTAAAKMKKLSTKDRLKKKLGL